VKRKRKFAKASPIERALNENLNPGLRKRLVDNNLRRLARLQARAARRITRKGRG